MNESNAFVSVSKKGFPMQMHRPLAWFGNLFLLVLLSTPGFGQTVRGGAGFLYGGESVWPGSANAVQQISQTSAGRGNDRYPLVGAEAYYRLNRWLLGITASALSNKLTRDGSTQSTIESSASNAHIWVGWIAWHTNRAKLYPSVGPGINSFNVNTTIANGQTTTHTLDGFSTDISLTFDWFVQKSGTDLTLMAGPLLSFRVGYRLTTGSAEWHGDSNAATTLVPTRYGARAFYVTLGVGGGGFRRH